MSTPSSKRPTFLRSLAAILLPAAVLAGCGKSDPQSANILLLTLDSTRADRLGCYGYGAASSPALDALAADGLLVERAISVAPLSLPSHASLLTGLYPPQHGVHSDRGARLAASATTLAEHLKAQGYRTAAVVGSSVVSAASGLDQGFDSYEAPAPGVDPESIVELSAEAVTDRALALLSGKLEQPFFLWVHYHDPHAVHAAPAPIGALYPKDPYNGEIAFLDQQADRLFDELRQRKLLDPTLVVLTGNHGESLGDHGESAAGLFVYDSTLRVPLILRLPGVLPAGRRLDGAVSGVDLAPTLIDLLGLPPMAGVAGVSFADAARGAARTPRDPVYAESELPRLAYGWSPLYALHDGRWKYIEAPTPELYDLQADPGETRNLASADPATLQGWAARLQALRAAWPEDGDALDAESRERLASLGYVAAGGAPGQPAAPPDPKRGYLLHEALVRARQLAADGEPGPALQLTERVLTQDPQNPTALALAAGLLHAAGRLPEAAATYRRVLEARPSSGPALLGLGSVLSASGDVEGARRAFQQSVDLDPGFADGWNELGVLTEKAGDLAAARRLYQRGLDAQPGHRGALFDHAKVSLRMGELQDALRGVETLLSLHPADPAGRFLDAQVRLAQGDEAAARTALEAFLSQGNADPRLVPTAQDQLKKLGESGTGS